MAASWKPLDIHSDADSNLPPLLIAAAFGSESYTIYLTDLTHIWSESLDRQSIVQRSQKESTSIDPSDRDQLQIFLQKIKLGVEGGKGTTSRLKIEDSLGRPGIALDIRVTLPGGLAPLEWTMNLSAASQSLLTNQLMIPLLEAQHARIQDVAGLEEVLGHKDHVIQKLLDKLESQGTHLGQIFPQVAAKGGRKVDREKAEEKVNGLRPFNLGSWRQTLSSEGSRDTPHLVKAVFGGEISTGLRLQSAQESGRSNDWWQTLKGKTVDLAGGKTEFATEVIKSKELPRPAVKTEESIQDDDDFQVQATPPRLASHTKPNAPRSIDDESTSEDDNLITLSQPSKIPDSFPSSPPPIISPPRKKLGALGGKKQNPKALRSIDEDETDNETSFPKPRPNNQPLPVPEPIIAKKKGGLGKLGGKKVPPPLPQESMHPPDSPAKPKKVKLGAIGGKKKEVAISTPQPETNAATEPLSPTSERTPKKKIGTIGGRDKTPAKKTNFPNEPEQSRGRPAVVEKKDTPPPRETSEERANKKRIQLKRDLEEKAKVPAKKKRRF